MFISEFPPPTKKNSRFRVPFLILTLGKVSYYKKSRPWQLLDTNKLNVDTNKNDYRKCLNTQILSLMIQKSKSTTSRKNKISETFYNKTRNFLFDTNSDFLITLHLQLNVGDL